MLRATLLFTLAILLIFSTVGSVSAQHPDTEAEHRLTALETMVGMIAVDVKELRDRGQYDWLKSLGMAGLVGEAGLRAVRRRKEKEN